MKKLKLLFAAFALMLGVSNASAQKDVTSQYITNATLSSLSGWTNVNFNTPARGNNTTGYAVEAYAGWGSLTMTEYSLTQTITLPAGHYTLVNYSFYRQGERYDTDNTKSLAYLKAGNSQVAVKTLGSITAAGYANSQAEGANCFDSKMYRNTLDFTIDADNTEIEIGVYGTHDLMRSWMILGMFELIDNDTEATMDSPFDVTGYITNPGFEYRDMSGWTVSPAGFFGTQSNSQSFKVGGYYSEKWQSSASGALPEGSMSQTLTNLPAGYYKLTANLGGNGTYIDLNGKTANWTADKDYTVGYVLSENEDLTITAGKTAEGTANWIHFDNFRLQFCGDVAAALTTLCAEVTNYESKLSASDYATLLNAVNGYNKSYSDVDELLAAIDAVQALYDSADLYVEYNVALAAAKAINQQSPMNGGVLSALRTAIGTTVTMESSAADKVSATNALKTATANANTSIANYSEAKGILDAANGYDAAGQASYAANETIAAIQDAYDDGSLVSVTSEQKAAAQTALVVACKAQIQPADDCDMTVYIVNPNINGNVDGWICDMNGNGGYAGGPLKPSNDAMEFWAAGTQTEQDHGKSFDYYQQITGLPVGAYTISAQMLNSTNGESGADWNGGGTSGLYGKTPSSEVQKLITVDSESFTSYTTDVILVVDGELRIGVKNIKAMTGRWFAATGFKLTYARQLTDEEKEEIAKKDAVARYNDAIAAALAIEESSIPSTAYNNLQTVITNNTLIDGTSSEYNAAAAALNEATEAANPLITPYSAWKALKAKADVLVVVANDNAEANSTLVGVISAQNTTVEGTTAASAIETATSALKTAMTTYVSAANPVGNDAQFDCTFMLTNPDLTPFYTGGHGVHPAGWNTEQEDGNYQVIPSEGAANPDGIHKYCYEYWSYNAKANDKFNLYTSVTLPEGTYSMSCYAFAKQQDGEAGKDPITGVYFYANDTQGGLVSDEKLTQKSLSFVNKSEQEVKIGLKPISSGNTFNWMGIGYVELYKVPAQVYAISENAAWDNSQSGAGKVTLTRTIKKGFNTLVLPFSMTQAEVVEKFGTGSVVYTLKSFENGIIRFNKADGISPNKPCILEATVAGTSYELEDRTIVAGDANPTSTIGAASLIGSYADSMTVPADANNYVVSGGMLYLVDSDVTIKGTRAYFNVPENQARTISMSFDDDVTGIATVENGEVKKVITGDIYDLQGRKVKKPSKGIYVVEGKKVVF